MFTFAVDYFVMVFVASLGVMQTAASIGGLRGLLMFKRPLIARPLGIGMAIAAIVWFFMVAERNINDYEGGLDSNEQGLLFFLAVATSGILTCILTSLLNRRMLDSCLRRNDGGDGRNDGVDADGVNGGNYDVDGGDAPDAGLGALRHVGWWQAITHNYRYWFGEARCWRTRIKRYFSG